MTLLKLYERYNTGGDYGRTMNATTSIGNIFTIGASGDNVGFTFTSMNLLLSRQNFPGILWVYVYAIDETGYPTGDLLSSGSTDANTLDTYPPSTWRNITMTPYQFSVGEKYCYFAFCPNAGGAHVAHVRDDESDPSYTGGYMIWDANPPSVPGGSGIGTEWCCLFEVWGEWTVDGPSSKEVSTAEDNSVSITTAEDVASPTVTSSTY